MSRTLMLLALIFGIAVAARGVADGAWLASVPGAEHDRTNPFHGQQNAISAGRRIFLDHCAGCHGKGAQGTKKRPPLRSQRVQQTASEGDLHWLLVNGNMWKGMPSWSKLPDPKLWQVIAYVKSLGE